MTTAQFQNPDRTWNPPANPCDNCHSTAALLFCRNHSAFICISCDAKVHSPTDKHARVFLCDVCEQSPAAVTCKADAASLCHTCDHDIHTANPLARRHERIPVVPFYDTAESAGINNIVPSTEIKLENYVDPWMLPNPSYIGSKYPVDDDNKSIEFFFNNSDQFLEENYGVSSQLYSDCVVPVQTVTNTTLFDYSDNQFEIDFSRSDVKLFNKGSYTASSLTEFQVSSSSIDVAVVPDGGSFSDISYPFVKNPAPIPNSKPDLPNQIGMDREARVLRYKVKRKSRKFEKTVRYASRKAYAETRPRIKGRFAKRTDGKTGLDDMKRRFGSGFGNFVDDDIFGVVPSFF